MMEDKVSPGGHGGRNESKYRSDMEEGENNHWRNFQKGIAKSTKVQ